jgi:monoamine oxidase
MTRSMTRRTFLRLTSAASAGAVVGLGPQAKAAAPKRVVILGAGLAGLSAAYELLKRDPRLEVTILEARTRVGGRVHTVRTHNDDGRTPFENGQYAEAGAHRIPDTHDRTLGYVSEFGLPLVQYTEAIGDGVKGQTVFVLKGERFFYDGAAWPAFLDFTAEERATAFFPQDVKYEYQWVTGAPPPTGTNHLGNPTVPAPVAPGCGAAAWPYGDGIRETLDEWNRLTLAEFLASRGASEDWIRLYTAENGTEIHSTTALAWLVQSALDANWDATYTLDGGLGQIPASLAKAVVDRGGTILFQSPVTAIQQTRRGVQVRYRDAPGAPRILAADRAICTIPFPVLRDRVDLSRAGLAADKLFWIERLQMMPAGRVSLQTRSRFWQAEGIEGLKLAGTDTNLERVWNSSNTQPGATGMIHTYLQHENALAMGAVRPRNRLAYVQDHMAKLIFPDIAGEWNGLGYTKLWHEDPWAGGAWLSPKPNQFIQGFHVWGRPEGRIHFAGEHTSLYAGWMQGAIESGQRAACEVAEAL